MLESELGRKLRDFILHMDDTYGDGTCRELAKVHSGRVYEALNFYSHNEFREYSIHDIYDELIINELMCSEEANDMVRETKRLVGLKTSVERVYKELDKDSYFREVLIGSYIDNASTSFTQKINRVKDLRTMDLIQKVSVHQLSKEKEKSTNKNVKKKEYKFHFKNPSN